MTPNVDRQDERVLVVSATTRGMAARAVGTCGFPADTVRDVSQAVTCLQRRKYRAVVVDLDTSEVDPLELVLNVRDFDSNVPIAVMATVWDAANMTNLGTQPKTMLIAKPNTVEELAKDLARLALLALATVQTMP